MLGVTGALIWSSWATEWRGHQAEFRNLVEAKFGPQRAAGVPSGLQQIWVKDLDRVDRCITCHQGVEWKGLETAPDPFRTHPAEILKAHPLDNYGCTSCHGGQGYATDSEAAHGFVEHWKKPLLGKQLSETYLVREPKAMLQMKCNECHRYDRQTKGADFINRAKKLVQEKGCRACHIINGRGGQIGPDLTYVGAKSPEQYDYARISGIQSAFAWHVAHLQNPKALDTTRLDLRDIEQIAVSSTAVARGRAVLLQAWPDDKEPVVVKLAQREKIQIEAEAYKEHIKDRLIGRFYAELEERTDFWDMGGICYIFMGSSQKPLETFANFYRHTQKPDEIIKPLEHLFGEVWSRHYLATHTILSGSLFEEYASSLKLREGLDEFPIRGNTLTIPEFSGQYLNPASWILAHEEDSCIASARLAITHGDLHGDNLFVDRDHCWAIDFERSGKGHILRDFVELEKDIIARLYMLPENNMYVFLITFQPGTHLRGPWYTSGRGQGSGGDLHRRAGSDGLVRAAAAGLRILLWGQPLLSRELHVHLGQPVSSQRRQRHVRARCRGGWPPG